VLGLESCLGSGWWFIEAVWIVSPRRVAALSDIVIDEGTDRRPLRL